MRPLRSKTGLTPPPSLSTKKYRENNPMDQFSRNSHNHTRVSVIKPSCRKDNLQITSSLKLRRLARACERGE